MNNSQTNNESSPLSLIIKPESEKWCAEDLNKGISIMDKKGFEEFKKKFQEELDKMTDDEFIAYCEKLGFTKNNDNNSNDKSNNK